MNLRAHCVWWNLSLTAADPDLQIMGGGGGEGRRSSNGHPDPVDPGIKGGAQSPKKFFSASVWSENKGGEGRAPPDPSPGSATDWDCNSLFGDWTPAYCSLIKSSWGSYRLEELFLAYQLFSVDSLDDEGWNLGKVSYPSDLCGWDWDNC